MGGSCTSRVPSRDGGRRKHEIYKRLHPRIRRRFKTPEVRPAGWGSVRTEGIPDLLYSDSTLTESGLAELSGTSSSSLNANTTKIVLVTPEGQRMSLGKALAIQRKEEDRRSVAKSQRRKKADI